VNLEDKNMNNFWEDAQIISTYSDANAIDDGWLKDISHFNVIFNGKLINRVTSPTFMTVNLNEDSAKETLSLIAVNAKFDGHGEDAWGIFQMKNKFESEKFWLIPNEVGGYTLMLPDDY
jgi:hypothetical protein